MSQKYPEKLYATSITLTDTIRKYLDKNNIKLSEWIRNNYKKIR